MPEASVSEDLQTQPQKMNTIFFFGGNLKQALNTTAECRFVVVDLKHLQLGTV